MEVGCNPLLGVRGQIGRQTHSKPCSSDSCAALLFVVTVAVAASSIAPDFPVNVMVKVVPRAVFCGIMIPEETRMVPLSSTVSGRLAHPAGAPEQFKVTGPVKPLWDFKSMVNLARAPGLTVAEDGCRTCRRSGRLSAHPRRCRP
jgi:hypothetical protein